MELDSEATCGGIGGYASCLYHYVLCANEEDINYGPWSTPLIDKVVTKQDADYLSDAAFDRSSVWELAISFLFLVVKLNSEPSSSIKPLTKSPFSSSN